MADGFRWRLAEDEDENEAQQSLFAPDDGIERRKGVGEFKGIEFLHVRAKSIINEVPGHSPMPFRFTINAYRGCSHACSYCLAGETPILMGDGRTRELRNLKRGDVVYGTNRVGNYLRYVKTIVKDHWITYKDAYRIRLADGTELIASADHRFLSDRGWKYVTGTEQGRDTRPHLTLNNKLIGTGHFAEAPKKGEEYERGYLCGMIRGDGHLGRYEYQRAGRSHGNVYRFRLALVDDEALYRARDYLAVRGISTVEFLFSAATENHKEVRAIRNSSQASVEKIMDLVAWPDEPTDEWRRGFLSGIFDAEGSHGQTIRISNANQEMIDWTLSCLERFGFTTRVEGPNKIGVKNVRIVGGLREKLRFFVLVDPAIERKRSIEGVALKSDGPLYVTAVEPLGICIPMYDITTETGDFIADGVVSHNCFARPTHEYLNLNIGKDFDTKIVVKINAVERLRAELRKRSWKRDGIAMGTNTDPYQRCEGKYQLTRGIIETLSEFRNPFSILTKSTLIVRDLDLLADAAQRTEVTANFSIPTLDADVWRKTEPGTPHPRQRVAAMRKLREAGIECGVLMAPILPGISDSHEQMAQVVEACVDAGASWIAASPLHLKPALKPHWMSWLDDEYPELAERYRRKYANRSYLPKAESESISAAARAMVATARRAQKVLGPNATTGTVENRANTKRADMRAQSE